MAYQTKSHTKRECVTDTNLFTSGETASFRYQRIMLTINPSQQQNVNMLAVPYFLKYCHITIIFDKYSHFLNL